MGEVGRRIGDMSRSQQAVSLSCRVTDIMGMRIAEFLTPRFGGRLEVKGREVEGQRAARAASAPCSTSANVSTSQRARALYLSLSVSRCLTLSLPASF